MTKKITMAAVIAAVYAVLTMALFFMAYGPVQFRVAEALTVLPFFFPAAIPGLTIGCILSNLLSGYGIIDIVFGSAATFIAALLTCFTGISYRKRIKSGPTALKKGELVIAPFFPVVLNALIIGTMITLFQINFVIALNAAFYSALALNVFFVFFGQFVCCYGLGVPLMLVFNKYYYNILKK